jgi:hypothetical protein
VLDLVFCLSVLIVMSSPAVDWFSAPVSLGQTPGYPEDRRLREIAAAFCWREVSVSWPPFVTPHAAYFDANSGMLHVASGSVLWALGHAMGESTLRVLGTPVLFPETLQGLGLSGRSRLLAFGDEAGYELGIPSGNSHREASVAAHGILDLTSIARQVAVVPSRIWTHKLGPIEAAIAVELPSGNASYLGAVLACRDGDVYFCAPPHHGVENKMQVLARLEAAGQPLHSISALHVSIASEPILWAANRSGTILVLGLRSGNLLGSFDALQGLQSMLGPRLRGSTPSRNISRILALTGNSTHLLMVAHVESSRPVLLSSPYPALRGDSNLGAEL